MYIQKNIVASSSTASEKFARTVIFVKKSIIPFFTRISAIIFLAMNSQVL